LRLVTFLPLPPDFSVPFFIDFISRSTLLPAALPYFRVDFLVDFFADFFVVLFFVAAILLHSPFPDSEAPPAPEVAAL